MTLFGKEKEREAGGKEAEKQREQTMARWNHARMDEDGAVLMYGERRGSRGGKGGGGGVGEEQTARRLDDPRTPVGYLGTKLRQEGGVGLERSAESAEGGKEGRGGPDRSEAKKKQNAKVELK